MLINICMHHILQHGALLFRTYMCIYAHTNKHTYITRTHTYRCVIVISGYCLVPTCLHSKASVAASVARAATATTTQPTAAAEAVLVVVVATGSSS